MDDIEDLLYQIEQEVRSGKKALFGSGVTVNGDVIYSLVDQIRSALPGVMREAKAIVNSSERRLQEESARAQNIVRQAQQRADEILSNHAIIMQAQQEAEAIRAQAMDYARHLTDDVNNDISDMLADAAATLSDSLELIRKAQAGMRK